MASADLIAQVVGTAILFGLALLAFSRLRRAIRAEPREAWRITRNASLGVLAISVATPVAVLEVLEGPALIAFALLLYGALAASVISMLVLLWRRRFPRGDEGVNRSIPERETAPVPGDGTAEPAGGTDIDPGWRTATTNTISGFVPFRPRREPPETSVLISLRTITLALACALPLYLFAFSFIAPWDGGDEGAAVPLLLVVVAGAVGGGWTISKRPLNSTTPDALADSYRRRYFFAIGMVELAPLGAILLTFVFQDSLWLIGIGVGGGLIGLWLVGPSRSNLARDQERIREGGSSLNLITVLNSSAQRDPGAPGRSG